MKELETALRSIPAASTCLVPDIRNQRFPLGFKWQEGADTDRQPLLAPVGRHGDAPERPAEGGPATNPPPEMWTKSGSDVGRAAAVSSDSQRRLPYVPPRSSEHFHRLKFYGALEKRERRTPQEPVWTRSGSSLTSAAGGSGAPVSPLGSGRGSPGSPFQSMSPRSRSFLPPDNVLPSYLYMVAGPPRNISNARRPRAPSEHGTTQSRTSTVLSLVNTMMGSTIMALPWGFFESGLIGGICIVMIACAFSFVTAAMVLRRGNRDLDFQHLVGRSLGSGCRRIAGIVNVLVMLGAAVAYHILMKDCLHVIGSSIIGWTDGSGGHHGHSNSSHTDGAGGKNFSDVHAPPYHTASGELILGHETASSSSFGASLSMPAQRFSSAYALWAANPQWAALMVLIVFPLTTLKKLTVLVRFNSLGIFFLAFNIFFMVYQGLESATSGPNGDGGWQAMVSGKVPSVPLSSGSAGGAAGQDGPWGNLWFKPATFGALAGMSMLAFFVHNAIHPIMRHSNPKTRLCDLSIAYMIVGSLYCIVGFAGALVLPRFAPLCFPEIKSPVCQNFLAMFDPNMVWAFMANTALFLQLFTVFPILMMIIRSEAFGLAGFRAYPGYAHVLVLNISLMVVTTSFAIWYPRVGEVLRFVGAGGGLIIMFLIPCLIDSIALCKREERARSESNAGVAVKAGSGGHPLGRFKVDAPQVPTAGGPSQTTERSLTRAEKARADRSKALMELKEGLWQRTSAKRCLRLIVNVCLVTMATGVLVLQFLE